MHDERLFATSVAAGNGTVFERVIDYLMILQNIKRIKASFAVNLYADSLGAASNLCGSAWNELRLSDCRAGIFGAVLNWLVVGNTTCFCFEWIGVSLREKEKSGKRKKRQKSKRVLQMIMSQTIWVQA